MSPRTLLRGLALFGRAISARRFSRNNARRQRRQWLGAESLEPRAMLSTVPFLADSALQTATVFTAQGRYGNNAINGDWELGITTNTNKPPQQQTGHVWNGSLDSATGVTTVREQFRFDVLNTTAASFGIGGSNISFDYAGQLTGNQPNAIKIWAKASTANSSLTLANLKLKTPGMSVPKEFPEASIAVSRSSGPDFQQRLIAGVDFSSGSGQPVTLTGDVWMSFAQTSPRGSSLQFHVMAVYLPVPIVTVDVAPGQVTEDDGQKLVYTFTRSIATASDLVVSYSVGGGAIAVDDYTGLPFGSGTQTITIPANQPSATLEILPTPDNLIEDDETVAISLLPSAGYTFDPNRSFATGTIENDDYLVDLVLDGLPEESAPPPNELSPGAILPIGGGRTRLDLIVESPGYAGTVTLFVTTGADAADAVTLWDSEEDGTQVLPATWQVCQHPRTLWVETTGVEADIQFIAMFQNKGTTKQDVAQAKPRIAAWSTAGAIENGNPDGKNQITPTFKSLTYAVDVDLATGDPAGTPPPGGPDDNALKGTAERLNKWTNAFAKQAGLGTDKEGRQFVGLFKWNVPRAARTFITTGFDRKPTDADYQHIGNAVRDGMMRNNIWRIEFVPAVAPWEWNATITLPEWKQFATEKDQLNPKVEEEWKEFVAALAGHEKIHKTKWEQYVRAYQSLVDDFAKTRFFGEAADPNDRTAKTLAWNSALRFFQNERDKLRDKLKALADGYNEEQDRYDEKSNHGRTQTLYDPAGQNVEAVNPGLRLQK
jgi:hypothetical protein